MFGIGSTELIVILLVVLIVLGPKRFPEIARVLGRKYRQIQRSLEDLRDNIDLEAMTEEQEKKEKDAGNPESQPGPESEPHDISGAP